MNCLEFRRLVLADPYRLNDPAAAHAEACGPCTEFLVRTLESEAQLVEALRVPVPEGFQTGLLDRTAAGRRSRGLALAASLVVGVATATFVGWPRSDPLALASIDFVVHEEAQTIAAAKPTDWVVLTRVASEMGLSLPQQLGDMRYICVYLVAGSAAHHLFVTTPLGKLTILLIPERTVGSRAVAKAHGLEAAVVPAARGLVAIIGNSSRNIARAESFLKSS